MTLLEALDRAQKLHLLASFAELRADLNRGEEAERHKRKAERLHREAYRLVRESA